MVEREITDIAQVTLSIGLASIYIYSSQTGFSDFAMSVYSLLLLAIIAFSHNIFTQLHMMKTNISYILSILSSGLLVLAIVGEISNSPQDWGSFWKRIGLSVSAIIYLGFAILSVSIVLSFKATPPYISEKKE